MEVDSQQQQQQSNNTPPPVSSYADPAKAVIGLHYDIPVTTTTTTTTTTTLSLRNSSNHQKGTSKLETVTELLQSARRDGYKYITCRIPDNISSKNMNTTTSATTAIADEYLSLTTIESEDWRTSIVGVMSITNLTTLNSTPTPTSIMMFMTKIKDQLIPSIEWCLHMNMPAIIIPSIDTICSMIRMATTTDHEIYFLMMIRQYANILLSCLIQTNVRDLQIWIPHVMSTSIIPTTTTTAVTTTNSSNDRTSPSQYFYQLVDYHPSIRTLYTFSSISTKNTTQKQQYTLLQHCIQQIHIDIGSLPPIAAIQIPTTLFTKNVRGFPTLKRMHQFCFIQLYRRIGWNIKVLLTQTTSFHEHEQAYSNLHPTQLGPTLLLPHSQYIHHLRTSKTEITSVLDETAVNGDHSDTTTTSTTKKIRAKELEYNDVLQSPLQPLADHLENYTYEIFEHDPIKYVQYEKAIYHTMYDYYIQLLTAQQHRLEQSAVPTTIHLDHPATMDTSTIVSSLGSTGSGNPPLLLLPPPTSSSVSTKYGIVIPYIVLVVGAGRGPLVTCTINAYDALLKTIMKQNHHEHGVQLQLYLYAVEKNPNAILFLRSKFRRWIHSDILSKDPSIKIQIVHSDLRYLNANTLFQNIVPQQQQQLATVTTHTTTVLPPPQPTSYKANLIVSELLGSFGCNELSPECLHTLLYRTNVCSNTMTKSIPYHYTSHIAPISSMKLYQNVKQQALYPSCIHSTQQQMIGLLQAFETPYVVRPYVASQIYNTQDCWSFTHTPLHSSASDTTTSLSHIHRDQERYVHLEFGQKNDNHPVTNQQPPLPFMYGAQYGTGYGPCDEYVQSMMMENQNNSKRNSSKSSSNNTSMGGEQHYHHQMLPEPQQAAWTCTGLLGTFTADLYHSTNNVSTNESSSSNSNQSIQISTNPNTFCTGMFSWFPLYFPSRQPIHVPEFGIVHVDIWRKCTSTKVWYEWMFTVVVESPSSNGSTTPMTTNSGNNNDNHNENTKMETDGDGNGANHTTTDHNSSTSTTVLYISPIHNPGGRSSYVSLMS